MLQDLLVRLPHPAEAPGGGVAVGRERRLGGAAGPGPDEELVGLDVPIRAGPTRGLQPDAVVHGGGGGERASASGRFGETLGFDRVGLVALP